MRRHIERVHKIEQIRERRNRTMKKKETEGRYEGRYEGETR
jgi:hypothetical protein